MCEQIRDYSKINKKFENVKDIDDLIFEGKMIQKVLNEENQQLVLECDEVK